MKVQNVRLVRFTTHTNKAFRIPESGIVGVTGANGSGKSSILEAVSWAVYGKTLRGADPSPCSVQVYVDGWEINRSKDTKTILAVEDSSDNSRTCDTSTKTQEVIDANFLPFDRWKRVCVFSSADAAHFSLATDAERKRFLEKVLGIDRFDDAEARAREELARSEKELASLGSRLESSRELYSNLLRKLGDSKLMLAGLYPPPEPYTLEQEQGAASVLKRAQEIRAAHKTHFDVTHSKISELQKSVDTAQVALRLAIDTCPACKRKFENAAEMQKHREETESAIHDLSQNIYRMKMELKERPDRVVDAERAEIEASKIQLARANWLGQIEAHEKTRATLQASIDAAESELATLKTRGAELKARHLALASEVGELELCVRVLGTRGARVLYLTEAVEQIEALANEYLLDLSPPGIQIKIHTQTLKKGGGYSDTLSIETVGDCGKSYDALSGGQRRRVDVALLLALADMSAAMSGVKGATLFFDEVFDALDSDGCEAVARLLERISKDRAVVLITHNKLLLETVKLTDYIRL